MLPERGTSKRQASSSQLQPTTPVEGSLEEEAVGTSADAAGYKFEVSVLILVTSQLTERDTVRQMQCCQGGLRATPHTSLQPLHCQKTAMQSDASQREDWQGGPE